MSYSPIQGLLAGILVVSEQRNRWVKGTLVADSSVTVEISFEKVDVAPLPGTEISYLGLWSDHRKRKTIFEFQLGCIVSMPTEDDWAKLVRPLVERLQGYSYRS